jgi:Metal binding domain of Ada
MARDTFVYLLLYFLMLPPVCAEEPNHSLGNERPYKYIGNTFTHIFHRPSCPFAKKMWTGHMILFQFRKQAIEDQYSPCRYCLPPFWLAVHASLKSPQPQSVPAFEPDTSNNPNSESKEIAAPTGQP